jgi:hypothetical protein
MSDVLELWNSAPKPDELTKAMQDGTHSDVIIPKGAIIDPLNAAYFGGTRGKPTSIPYTTLRRMAQIPAIAAVINTRLNQVANHAKRPKFSGDKGFKIALKDRDAKMDDAKRKRAKEIEDFFLKTGWEKNKVRKDNFNQYLRKLTRDTLTLDVMTFEKVNKVGGALKGKMDLAEIWAIDAATIELVLNNPIGEGSDFQIPVYRPETKSGIQNIGEIAYVQKVNGTTVAEYTEDELAFAIRNPRTDLEFTDFGMSELETLIEIVTGIVNGIKYNTSYFSSSSLPQGVLSIVGKYKDEHLKAFQRHWKTLTEGAAGKWAVPVMASEDGTGFNWTPFKNSNRDMEFNQFLEFLFNIACAVYQIDPNEVGFKSWTSNSGGMSQSDNTAEKNDMSKDKGFVPLMTFLSDTFNSEIVDLIDDEFEFQWIGVDEEDEDKKLERIKNEIDSGIKVPAMVWKELDADVEELKAQNGGKLPDWAYAPANAQLIQVYTAGMQAQQQQAQMEQQGAMQQQQQQGDQQSKLAIADDAHKKQLEIMDKQHQHGIEQNQLQQKAQQQGELKKQGNEFDHQKEMADIQHKQTKELSKDDQKHQVGMAEMQAEQAEKQQAGDHDHQKEMANVQGKQAEKQQGNDHKHQKEMASVQASQAEKQQGNDHKHQKDMASMQQLHDRNKQANDQKHQIGMADHQHKLGEKAKDGDRKHADNTSKTSHKNNMEAKKADHAHQKEIAKLTAEQKAKKDKLKKSIENEFASKGFDIDWGDY